MGAFLLRSTKWMNRQRGRLFVGASDLLKRGTIAYKSTVWHGTERETVEETETWWNSFFVCDEQRPDQKGISWSRLAGLIDGLMVVSSWPASASCQSSQFTAVAIEPFFALQQQHNNINSTSILSTMYMLVYFYTYFVSATSKAKLLAGWLASWCC